jgi:hypothetical protein
MSGAIPPLPDAPCWVYRNNFTALTCVELPYALLLDDSKMEHRFGFLYVY